VFTPFRTTRMALRVRSDTLRAPVTEQRCLRVTNSSSESRMLMERDRGFRIGIWIPSAECKWPAGCRAERLGRRELSGGEPASLLVVKVGVLRREEFLNRLRPPRSHPQGLRKRARKGPSRLLQFGKAHLEDTGASELAPGP